MAAAKTENAPAGARLSLTEIYTVVHKRDTSVLPETTKVAILAAWREGRLPLSASEVRIWRRLPPPFKPDVWITRPSYDDDHDIRVVGGVILIYPPRELKSHEAYLPELPSSSPTAIVGDWPAERIDPTKPTEILFNQPLSARTGIKFHWMTGTAKPSVFRKFGEAFRPSRPSMWNAAAVLGQALPWTVQGSVPLSRPFLARFTFFWSEKSSARWAPLRVLSRSWSI